MFTEEFQKISYAIGHKGLRIAFLFGPFALALVCYIWAFCSQSHKLPAFREFFVLSLKRRERELRGTQHLFYSAFSLLVVDGFTLIFGLVWAILMLCDMSGLAPIIFMFLWIAFRIFSQCQHLITALVAVIFCYHPSWGDGLRSISKVLNIVPFILIMLTFRVNSDILIGVDVYNVLLAVGIVVSCCLSSSSPMAEQRKPIGLLSLSLFFFVCLPFVVLNILTAVSDDYVPYALDVLIFTNFYIIMSGLLFYLIFRLKEEDHHENQYECAIRSE